MTPDSLLDMAKAIVSDDAGRQFFAEKALWFAGFSQEATAIPWLTLVAASSLLVVIVEIVAVAWIVRSARRWWRGMRGYG